MKKIGLLGLCMSIVMVLVLVACAAPPPSPSPSPAPAPKPAPAPAPASLPTVALPERLTIGSHAVGTTIHAIVTAHCKVASEKTPILTVVLPTTGPPAWIPQLVSTGKPELGVCHIMEAWWAYNGKVSPVPIPDEMLGTKPFYQASPNLRALAANARMACGNMVRNDSKYKTLPDMKGARLAFGYAGQPAAFINLIFDMVNYGMTLKDFKEVPVANAPEGVKAVREGRADGTNSAVGMPQNTEADAAVGIRFLPGSMKPEDVKRASALLPGGNYENWEPGPSGIKERTPLLTYPTVILTSTSLSDEVAETLLTAWWDNLTELRKLHPAFERMLKPEMFVIEKISIPYHEGAVKFYKKKGVWSAKMDTIQQRLLKGEYPFLD